MTDWALVFGCRLSMGLDFESSKGLGHPQIGPLEPKFDLGTRFTNNKAFHMKTK